MQVVWAIKFRRQDLASLVDKSCSRFHSAWGIPSKRVARAVQWVGQWGMKCNMVSSCSWQHGNSSESALFIWWRCLASGMCPVTSWVMMLVCFRDSLAIAVK